MQMEATNYTTVTEFELAGFLGLEKYATLLFAVFLVIYLLILGANTLIFILISATSHLHIPMYYFISILSVLEMLYTTVTMPKLLVDFLRTKKSISFRGCLLQIYFFHSLGISEACLLTAMAYDRYVAICSPLNYSATMTPKHCFQLALGCCVCGFLCPLPEILLTSTLPFCQSNHVDHIFCDFPPLISLACTDISTSIVVDFSFHSIVIVIPIFIILFSYTKILKVIFKIKTVEGRKKAFSTCISHLIVVLTFFGTISFMYMRLTWTEAVHYDRAIAIIYAFLIPLFNPVIYTLRNKEIRAVIRRIFPFSILNFGSNRRLGF